MTAPVRRAGTGRRPDGSSVTWTVAEGRKGRRWRETVTFGGAVAWTLLYETDAEGRFAHLELATAGGLATLHPEPDGTLHGNTVDAAGVHHIRGVPFAPGTSLVVSGSTVVGAAVAASVTRARAGMAAVVLDPMTLRLDARSVHPDDLTTTAADGTPALDDAVSWPLEEPPEA